MNIIKENNQPHETRWMRSIHHITTPLGKDGKRVTGCEEHIALSKKIAGEGMVLLENDGILPLKPYTKLALFGVGCINYIKGGYGSGAVHSKYVRNIYEGFAEKGELYPVFDKTEKYYYDVCERHYEENSHLESQFVQNPGKLDFVPEPEINERLVKEAADFADVAIVSIHRNSGEGWDRSSEKGDFYLTDAEDEMIKFVTKYFKDIVVVLNVGGMIDVDWIKTNPSIKGALLAWQAGMEGATAICDILCGDINPSGKLTDTFAKTFLDYPSADTFDESEDYTNYYEDIYVGYRYFETVPGANKKVNYPFGYGLSYTTFDISKPKVLFDGYTVNISVTVKNTGKVPGKEVVQIYYSAPQGKLGKPKIELAAFKKTELLSPGNIENIYVSFPISDMASYDDLGKCAKSAYILEKGDYKFFAGNSCENLTEADTVYTVNEEFIVVQQLTTLCAPNKLEKRMLADGSFEALPAEPIKTYNPVVPEITAKAPERELPYILKDVADGIITLDEFIAQLSMDDLIFLTGGHRGYGVTSTSGFAGLETDDIPGTFGKLKYTIPFAMTADGPQGARLNPESGIATTAWPCATLLACTFNSELALEMGKAGALEIKENALSVWLTPALNIHRNPLCGRNFEYYSEDPLISGTFAAAIVNGMQSQHIAASPKHFACNNRETNRCYADSRLSERALREIYLRGFEICVKKSHPWTIMTSYNLINGRRCCESYEQLTLILRDEWGFDGMVTTDWHVPCYHPNLIKAGNDVRMARGQEDEIRAAVESGELSRGLLEQVARNVITLVLRLD